MTSPAAGALRLVRALAVALVVVALAAGGHVLAGGAAPSPLLLGAGGVAVLLAATVLAGRRLSGTRIVALLGLGQAGLHTLLALSPAPACAEAVHAAASGPAGHAVHAVHAVQGIADAAPAAAGLCATAGGHAHAGDALLAGGTAMLAAHVAATALTAVLLLHGERALWLLWGWLLPAARVVRAAPLPVFPRLPRPEAALRVAPRPVLLDAASRRGPPVRLTVCPTFS